MLSFLLMDVMVFLLAVPDTLLFLQAEMLVFMLADASSGRNAGVFFGQM